MGLLINESDSQEAAEHGSLGKTNQIYSKLSAGIFRLIVDPPFVKRQMQKFILDQALHAPSASA